MPDRTSIDTLREQLDEATGPSFASRVGDPVKIKKVAQSAIERVEKLESRLEEARVVAKTAHVVARTVLVESWDDPYNQVPGRKCCEVTKATWTNLDQTVRAMEQNHHWLTDGQEDDEDA